jgi:hypothetical protein
MAFFFHTGIDSVEGVRMKESQKTALSHQPGKPTQNLEAGKLSSQPDLQQVLDFPQAASSEEILPLQEKAGNRAVSDLFQSRQVQREPLTDSSGTLKQEISSAIQGARGSGTPMPQPLQEKMERHHQTGLGAVRLHTGPRADQLSRQLSARAFTVGSDIFFKDGAYSPDTSQGQKTLHHELTHVVQQGGKAPGGSLKLGGVNTPQEQQADQAARSAAASAPASDGTLQREMDYAAIAAKFGGGITAEMVKSWVQNVKPEDEDSVQITLQAGRSMPEFQKSYLKKHGIDVNKMDQDVKRLGGSVPETQQKPPTLGTPLVPPPRTDSLVHPPLEQAPPKLVPPPRSDSLVHPPLDQGPQVPAPVTEKPAPNNDEKIRQYILNQSTQEKMPSGPLLDILKDVGGGSLAGVSEAQVNEVIKALKDRDFDGLAKKNVSISKIVSFTSSFERQGIGDTDVSQDRGAVTSALLGGKGGKGAAQNTADFLQNSILLSLGFGITGGVLGQSNMMEKIFNTDIGAQDQANMNLASGIAMNTGLAVQSLGQGIQSGIDFNNMRKAGSYHKSTKAGAMGQSGVSGFANLFQSGLGFAGAGLGFGQTGVQFGTDTANAQAGVETSTNSTADALGLGKSILGTTQSGLSTITSSAKAGAEAIYASSIKKTTYKETPYLTPEGKAKEKAVFPKLKSLLVEAAEKKGKGQGMEIAGNAVNVAGGLTRSLGYIAESSSIARTITGLIGTGTSIGVPVIKGITNFIKGKVRDKKIEKAGFRNEKEYRMERLREVQSYDEKGNAGKDKFTVSVHDVLDQTEAVYEDHDTWAKSVGNESPAKKADEKASLSVSRLLNHTGEFTLMQTVLVSPKNTERREAIKSIILARQANY